VVRVLWDDWIPGTWQAKRKLPRQYVPYDARLIEWMKATYQRIQQARDVRREMERELQARFEAEDLALQKVEDETEANLREDAYSLLQAGMKAERTFQNGPRFQETKA
jgi:RNA polymerase-binding transcription factor DksA